MQLCVSGQGLYCRAASPDTALFVFIKEILLLRALGRTGILKQKSQWRASCSNPAAKGLLITDLGGKEVWLWDSCAVVTDTRGQSTATSKDRFLSGITSWTMVLLTRARNAGRWLLEDGRWAQYQVYWHEVAPEVLGKAVGMQYSQPSVSLGFHIHGSSHLWVKNIS